MRSHTLSAVGVGVAAFALVTSFAPTATGTPQDSPAQRIAFVRIQGGVQSLWTANPDGTNQRNIWTGRAFFPAWSSDHSRLLFDFTDAGGNEQIATIHRDGTGFQQLTNLPGISETAEYTPDGKSIIFCHFSPTQPVFYTSLWVMNVDGSNPRPMIGPASNVFVVEPDISPDGTEILYGRIKPDTDPQQEALFVVNSQGLQPRQVTPYLDGLEHPQWSADGKSIAYSIDPGLDSGGVWLVQSHGTHRHRIFKNTRLDGYKPDFSPDGTRILFGCLVVATQERDLCTMGTDGSDLHHIVRTPGVFENWPVWR